MSVDLARLSRALQLTVTKLNVGRWTVRGADAELGGNHLVTIEPRDDGPERVCSCLDYLNRRGECKHLLAVRLSGLDADILAGLRLMVPATTAAQVVRR